MMQKNKTLLTIFTILLTTTILYTSINESISKKQIKTASKNFVKTGLIYNEDNSYTEIFKTIVKLTGLSEEEVKKGLELDYVNEIITDLVNSIYEYNLTGNENVKYSSERIIKIVEDNIDKVTTDINYPLSEKDKKEAINYTKNNTDYIIQTIYTTNIGDWSPNKKWLI